MIYMNQENDAESAHPEEIEEASISIYDIYKLAARKIFFYYVEGDEESEQILALEIENVRNDPAIHYGSILDAIKELFPEGKYPPHIQKLYDEMIGEKEGRGPIFDDESILKLGADMAAALGGIKETNKEDKS